MLTLILFAALLVLAAALLVVWLFPPASPRRYTGKLKKLG